MEEITTFKPSYINYSNLQNNSRSISCFKDKEVRNKGIKRFGQDPFPPPQKKTKKNNNNINNKKMMLEYRMISVFLYLYLTSQPQNQSSVASRAVGFHVQSLCWNIDSHRLETSTFQKQVLIYKTKQASQQCEKEKANRIIFLLTYSSLQPTATSSAKPAFMEERALWSVMHKQKHHSGVQKLLNTQV